MKTRVALAFIAVNLILSGTISLLLADNKQSLLKEEITYLKQKVDDLSRKTRSLGEDIEYLERQAEVVAKEKALTLERKKELEQSIKNLQLFIEKTNKQINVKSDYLKMRLKELYKKEDYLLLEILLFPESEESMIHSTNLFTFTSKKDNEALLKLKDLKNQKEKAEFDFNRNKTELDKKLAELTENQLENRRITQQKKTFFKKITSEKTAFLNMLEERNQLLQELISILSVEQSKNNPSAIPITRFKGLLSYPVKGRILENFGKVRNKKFGTYLKNNGIKLRVQKGSEVNAFYDGIVVFADWYKSYGKLIIIDHGDGYFSFYGHLDSFNVKINQIVLTGEPVGLSGNTGSLSGDVLHFELWHKKTPMDPAKWVRKNR